MVEGLAQMLRRQVLCECLPQNAGPNPLASIFPGSSINLAEIASLAGAWGDLGDDRTGTRQRFQASPSYNFVFIYVFYLGLQIILSYMSR